MHQQIIRQACRNNLQSTKCTSSLKYLAFLAQNEHIFNAALSHCDFEMARCIGKFSQMDPKVYMPLIESFESISRVRLFVLHHLTLVFVNILTLHILYDLLRCARRVIIGGSHLHIRTLHALQSSRASQDVLRIRAVGIESAESLL